jgi:hypothetical protein
VIEKRDKARNRPLKVNVVLPERVVGVDEESLGGQASSSWPLASSVTQQWDYFNDSAF